MSSINCSLNAIFTVFLSLWRKTSLLKHFWDLKIQKNHTLMELIITVLLLVNVSNPCQTFPEERRLLQPWRFYSLFTGIFYVLVFFLVIFMFCLALLLFHLFFILLFDSFPFLFFNSKYRYLFGFELATIKFILFCVVSFQLPTGSFLCFGRN